MRYVLRLILFVLLWACRAPQCLAMDNDTHGDGMSLEALLESLNLDTGSHLENMATLETETNPVDDGDDDNDKFDDREADDGGDKGVNNDVALTSDSVAMPDRN